MARFRATVDDPHLSQKRVYEIEAEVIAPVSAEAAERAIKEDEDAGKLAPIYENGIANGTRDMVVASVKSYTIVEKI